MPRLAAIAALALFLLTACATQAERNCRHLYGRFPHGLVTDWRVRDGACQVLSRNQWVDANALYTFVK
jgi:outer membrane biogenesis lipoprotein LolB